MLWIHPFWQIVTILLGWYVFYLGWARFVSINLSRHKAFLWKRHVALGKAAFYMWIYGGLVGFAAAWVKWRTFGVTGIHLWVGIIILLLSFFGYWSGLHMDNYKKHRKILPPIHGANNLLILFFSLFSIFTGTRTILRLIL